MRTLENALLDRAERGNVIGPEALMERVMDELDGGTVLAPLESRPPRRRRPGWAIALTASALVVLAVGLPVWLLQPDTGVETTIAPVQPQTTLPSVTSPESPEPTTAPVGEDSNPFLDEALREEAETDLGYLTEGLTCALLVMEGLSYDQAVAYWMRHDQPEQMNVSDGVPCPDRTSWTKDLFGGPMALEVLFYIESDRLEIDGPRTGRFEAIGPAVDNGIVCPSGTVDEDTYVCDDGSGEFVLSSHILLNVYTDSEGGPIEQRFIDDESIGVDAGSWSVTSGTGPYAELAGGGGFKISYFDFDALWSGEEHGKATHTFMGRIEP